MDFVNVKDIVQANMLAMESEISNQVFNVGTGISTTIKELAEILISSVGEKVIPEFSGEKSIVQQRRADITKIKKMLNFKPTIDVNRGLKEVVKEIRKNEDEY